MLNIVLFGKPGSGKGTQAEFIKKKYNLVHISTGEVFRSNIISDTRLGKIAKSYIERGDLVPDSLTIEMLKTEVEKYKSRNGFIFDGFPRTKDQAIALDKFLKTKEMRISATISLEADDKELIKRLLLRGKKSGRIDDQDEKKIENRFEEYSKKTSILREYYNVHNKFYTINGVGSVVEISNRLSSLIDDL